MKGNGDYLMSWLPTEQLYNRNIGNALNRLVGSEAFTTNNLYGFA